MGKGIGTGNVKAKWGAMHPISFFQSTLDSTLFSGADFGDCDEESK
jgi:hypothetical protein